MIECACTLLIVRCAGATTTSRRTVIGNGRNCRCRKLTSGSGSGSSGAGRCCCRTCRCCGRRMIAAMAEPAWLGSRRNTSLNFDMRRRLVMMMVVVRVMTIRDHTVITPLSKR